MAWLLNDLYALIALLGTEIGNLVSPDWWRANWMPMMNIIAIDVVLAGDNAIIVGLAASRVASEFRSQVIFWGIVAAVVLRIFFAAITAQLLAIGGIMILGGGILLLWVCWKMYRQIVAGHGHETADTAALPGGQSGPALGFWSAVWTITLADVSMSLDNVLAVAGAAKGSTLVLVIGLIVAIVLMALASRMIAELLTKYPWITWIGLAIITYVAFDMVFSGLQDIACETYQTGCNQTFWQWVTGSAPVAPAVAPAPVAVPLPAPAPSP